MLKLPVFSLEWEQACRMKRKHAPLLVLGTRGFLHTSFVASYTRKEHSNEHTLLMSAGRLSLFFAELRPIQVSFLQL